MTVVWPGMVTAIVPPRMHWQTEVGLSTGAPLIRTVGPPGVQGVVMAGIQGTAVGTPLAAAVAVTTAGLVGEMHCPNVAMLMSGAKSMTVATGLPATITGGPLGTAVRGIGGPPGTLGGGPGSADMLHLIM